MYLCDSLHTSFECSTGARFRTSIFYLSSLLTFCVLVTGRALTENSIVALWLVNARAAINNHLYQVSSGCSPPGQYQWLLWLLCGWSWSNMSWSTIILRPRCISPCRLFPGNGRFTKYRYFKLSSTARLFKIQLEIKFLNAFTRLIYPLILHPFPRYRLAKFSISPFAFIGTHLCFHRTTRLRKARLAM